MQHLVPFIVSIALFLSLPIPTATSTHEVKPTHIVCIDAGHGADDSGATYQDLTEAAITLDIAQKLHGLLKKQGYQIVLTRPDANADPTNSERAEICNKGHAQALISIHLNYNDDTTLDYTQGLYGMGNEDKDKKFADFMTHSVSSKLGVPNGETTDFDSNLMHKANMPATLLEVVFLTSPQEYPLLKDGTRQQQIAEAIDAGIMQWFQKKK